MALSKLPGEPGSAAAGDGLNTPTTSGAFAMLYRASILTSADLSRYL